MEAPRNAAGQKAHETHKKDQYERVARGRERFAGEYLAAFAGTREDRLQGAVVALGSNDVARNERGQEREPPDRHEEQHDEWDGEPRVSDVAAKRYVVRAGAALDLEHHDEDDRDRRRREQAE